jgi:hypothetical protein
MNTININEVEMKWDTQDLVVHLLRNLRGLAEIAVVDHPH